MVKIPFLGMDIGSEEEVGGERYGYGSIPMKIPFVRGMNIHKSQLF